MATLQNAVHLPLARYDLFIARRHDDPYTNHTFSESLKAARFYAHAAEHLYRVGNIPKAKRTFEKAAEKYSYVAYFTNDLEQKATSHENAADLYAKAGSPAESRFHYSRAFANRMHQLRDLYPRAATTTGYQLESYNLHAAITDLVRKLGYKVSHEGYGRLAVAALVRATNLMEGSGQSLEAEKFYTHGLAFIERNGLADANQDAVRDIRHRLSEIDIINHQAMLLPFNISRT